MNRLVIPLLAILLSLSACGGGRDATKTVRYELPASAGGRMCADQCRTAQDFCQQGCSLKQRRCTDAMEAQAIHDYEDYARSMFGSKQSMDLYPRDFERPELCRDTSCSDDCESRFQACYTKCGGTVDITTSCTAFCF